MDLDLSIVSYKTDLDLSIVSYKTNLDLFWDCFGMEIIPLVSKEICFARIVPNQTLIIVFFAAIRRKGLGEVPVQKNPKK